MNFKIGVIVSHIKSYNKFYTVLKDLNNGQYLVEDEFKNSYVFLGKYLLTKEDRRDSILENILQNEIKK